MVKHKLVTKDRINEGEDKMDGFKLNSLISVIIFGTVVCIGLVLISGSAKDADQTEEEPVITLEVCPTAEITTLSYFMKTSKLVGGGPKLHFEIGIKNISSQSRRYKLSIILPKGPSSVGFYPRKGNPPVLKPGQEKTRTFPMCFDRIPDSFTLTVEECAYL